LIQMHVQPVKVLAKIVKVEPVESAEEQVRKRKKMQNHQSREKKIDVLMGIDLELILKNMMSVMSVIFGMSV